MAEEDIKDQQEEQLPEEEVEEQPEGEDAEPEATPEEQPEEEAPEEDSKDEDWGGADEEKEARKEKRKHKSRDDMAKLYRRIQEEQAEKSLILSEAQQYKQQAEYYKSLTDQTQTALAQEHQTSADQFYHRAEREYKEAVESQDVEAIASATAKFMEASRRKERADEIKIQHEYRLQEQQQQLAYQQQVQANDPKIVNRMQMQIWSAQNPWANERDRENFDPVLYAHCLARGNELIEWANKEPGVDPLWKFSPGFFAEIDKHMQNVKAHLSKKSKQPVPMNQAKGNPSPVRSNAYPSGRAKETLTEADKRMFEKIKARMPTLTQANYEAGIRKANQQLKRGESLITTGGSL